jgi:hypothetical protein
MQTCTEQQMQPDAANPVQVPAAATLPISGAEQQLGKLPDETECIQPGSTTRDTALQLMHRAASVPLTEAESPRSDAAGEYCMRLVRKHRLHTYSTICLLRWHCLHSEQCPAVSPSALTLVTLIMMTSRLGSAEA